MCIGFDLVERFSLYKKNMKIKNIRYFKIISSNSFCDAGIWLHISALNIKYIRKCVNLKDFRNIDFPEPKSFTTGFYYDLDNIQLDSLINSISIFKKCNRNEAIKYLKNLNHPKVPKWKKIWKGN